MCKRIKEKMFFLLKDDVQGEKASKVWRENSKRVLSVENI